MHSHQHVGAERALEGSDEHEVTPLELFFDLTFVFAMTLVTIFVADDPTWGGVFRGMLVLAALWWAWSVYAWLTSAMDVDEGGVRLAMLGSTGAMFGVALAVPGAFGDDAVLFGVPAPTRHRSDGRGPASIRRRRSTAVTRATGRAARAGRSAAKTTRAAPPRRPTLFGAAHS